MNDITTNFYEITPTPAIECLYETEIRTRTEAIESSNAIVNKTKDSVLSLYPLAGSRRIEPEPIYIEWLIRSILFKQIDYSSDFFDLDWRNSEFSILNERLVQRNDYSILRRVVFRAFHASGRLFLAIDPITKLYNRLTLNKLLATYGFSQQEFLEYPGCLVFVEQSGSRKWVYGKIREITSRGTAKVEVRRIVDGAFEVNLSRVIPTLNKTIIANIATRTNRGIDLDKELKRHGDNTSQAKLDAIEGTFQKYLYPLFPLRVRDISFEITRTPVDAEGFTCAQIRSDSEPGYVITRDGVPETRSRHRLAGLGSVNITSEPKLHKVVLFATDDTMESVTRLVTLLNDGIREGSYFFSMPSKFGIKLVIAEIFQVPNYDGYSHTTDMFVHSNEEKHRDALALVFLPKNSDLYYPLKAKLAFHGKVSQVVSTTSFNINSLWNLGTNIFAKFGYKPWGISEGLEIPHADIVFGFAYSSLKSEGRLKRNVAYVNVFDRKGVWQFVHSASGAFDFDKRLKAIPQMMKDAALGYLASGSSPAVIDIHYSKRFSYEERLHTVRALRDVVPTLQQINFISLDKTHPLRLFDKRTGSLNFLRGGTMALNEREFLMSIAGTHKPGALASRLLKVRLWQDPMNANPDLVTVAHRILAMSKLNWRSAVRDTAEPVTLKYAEEIANLTNHFSLTEWNMVSNQLAQVPWFI